MLEYIVTAIIIVVVVFGFIVWKNNSRPTEQIPLQPVTENYDLKSIDITYIDRMFDGY